MVQLNLDFKQKNRQRTYVVGVQNKNTVHVGAVVTSLKGTQ